MKTPALGPVSQNGRRLSVFICVHLWFRYDDGFYHLGAVRVGQVHPGAAAAGRCAGADVFDLVHHARAARATRWKARIIISSRARSSRSAIGRGEFLEHAEVFGNYYGTHRGVLERAQAAGIDLVLDIDVQGARQLKSKIPEAVTVFILAPSRQILEQRLRARSEDSDAVIERRLRDAANEIRNYSAYDYVLINKELERVGRNTGRHRARREGAAQPDRGPDPADSGNFREERVKDSS